MSSVVDTFFSQVAGTQYGSFFRVVPPYVNKSLPPGHSSIPLPTVFDWLRNALLLKPMWGSPNTVWCIIAVLFYYTFPYDLSPTSAAAQSPLSTAFFLERFPLYLALVFGYDAFWHIALYFFSMAQRPFQANRVYNYTKMLHNLFYSLSGVAIWVVFENVMCFVWATGRMAYLADKDAFSSTSNMLLFFGGLVGVALWRDAHFYCAHRFLHFKPLYNMVHSLHHRNQDIEPFSGLTMHPIEHLYYYACILPSLFIFSSPLHFLWNGVHLLLSPGASHSGWEDHFQSDAYHYMHHKYFECNYAGTGAAFLDNFFGTFKARFTEADKLDKAKKDGAAGDGVTFESAAAPTDPKSNLLNFGPILEEFSPKSKTKFSQLRQFLYMVIAVGCLAVWAHAAIMSNKSSKVASENEKLGYSFLAGYGPVLLSILMHGGIDELNPKSGLNVSPVSFLVHATLGSLMCAVPVMKLAYMAF